MVQQIVFKKRFLNKLEHLLIHIEQEFGLLVAQKFATRLTEKLNKLQEQPFTGKPSIFIKDTRSIRAGNHHRIYYKVEGNKLIVLNIYDTRINPRKNKLK
jgi:plasmid stabilization system protein ParE